MAWPCKDAVIDAFHFTQGQAFTPAAAVSRSSPCARPENRAGNGSRESPLIAQLGEKAHAVV